MATFAILGPIYTLFGNLLNLIVRWIGNYGWAVLLLTLVFRTLTEPLQIKMRKNGLKMQCLQSDFNEIQRLYPKDVQTQQRLRSELMKQHGVSQLSGCLPSLIPMILLFGIWQPLSRPLYYVSHVSIENLKRIADFLLQHNYITEAVAKQHATRDILLVNALHNHSDAFATVVNNGWMSISQLPDMNFLGMNLSLIPTWRPSLLFGAETWSTYLPLLVFPLLTIVVMAFMMRLTTMTMMNQGPSREEKARSKKNPAKRGQNDGQQAGAGMMKTMNLVMPVIMLWTVFSSPAALGIYWIASYLVSIVSSLLFLHYYVNPMRQFLAASTQSRAVKSARKIKNEADGLDKKTKRGKKRRV